MPSTPASVAATSPRERTLAELVVADSHYRKLRGPGAIDESSSWLARSLAEVGQLSAVVAHCRADGRLHLVDGFARVAAARALGWERIQVTEVPAASAATEVADLLVSVRGPDIHNSATAQAIWAGFLLADGVSKKEIVERYLEPVGLQPHRRRLEQCLHIARQPAPLLAFGSAKGLSMGQLSNLGRHRVDLVELVMSWRGTANLTAAIADELLDSLADLQRQNGLNAQALAAQLGLQAILASGAKPPQITQRLRAAVRRARSPILTAANERMAEVCAELRLHPKISLEWDRTLERHEVRVGVKIDDPSHWSRHLQTLAQEDFAAAIAALFEEL